MAKVQRKSTTSEERLQKLIEECRKRHAKDIIPNNPGERQVIRKSKLKKKKAKRKGKTYSQKLAYVKVRMKTNIDKINDCWLWKGNKSENGYGIQDFMRKKWRAHRLSYTLFVGPIPEGLCVCHTCDEPACINPDHLFLGTHKENMQDLFQKGRHPLWKHKLAV